MSITFAVNGDAPQAKVYCKDRFPNLDDDEFEGFPGYEKDEIGLYFYESIWPEINMGNDNAYAILGILGLPKECCGNIEFTEIPSIRRKIIQLLNSDIPDIRTPISIDAKPRKVLRSINGTERVIHPGNCAFYSFGLLADGVKERLNRMLDLLLEAQKLNLGICWG